MSLITQKNGTPRFLFRLLETSLPALLFCLSLVSVSSAQESMPHQAQTMTPLAELLREAEQNNPQIQAARQSWQAAKQVPTQVSTLPDPQFTLQHFSVGSPRPFAGYTNSDFAYIGLGVSQDIPYPGKLRLKGEIAKREADVSQQQVESVRRAVLAELKGIYFQLAYLSKTLTILEQDGELLKHSQESPDIEPADLTETPLAQTYGDLLAAAQVQNPEIASAKKMIERQSLQVNLARKDFYPDFNVQYMWQRTDPTQFRAYYMLSFGVRVPIYRGRKQRPELAQAEAEKLRAGSELQAQSQQIAAELRGQYVQAQQTSELLRIHREGLSPQSRSEFQAALATYQSNKQDFQALLAAFLDLLHFDEEYWQNVAEYETSIARLEQITGLSLR